MKKIAKSLLAVIAVVVLAFTFAGCASSVKGNTYAFSEITAEYPKDADDLTKAAIDLVKAGLNKTMTSLTVTFEEDGTVKGTASKWTQKGDKVTVTTGDSTSAEYTVKGDKLTQSYSEGGYKFKIVLKKK